MLLGGSWIVMIRFISRITTLTTNIRGLVAPLTTALEPPSMPTTKSVAACGIQGISSSSLPVFLFL